MLVRAAGLVVLLALVAASTAIGSRGATHVVLDVSPPDALIDQPIAILLSGLTPGSTATLTATTTDIDGRRWRSSAVFRANSAGIVSPGGPPAPLSGTYRGVDPMGLLWSMHELGVSTPHDEQSLEPPAISTVRFQALVHAKVAATATLTRRWQTAGVTVRRTTLARDGFISCYWSPPSTSRRMPAILVLGGSEGGLGCLSGILASHGYPELEIGYFGLPGLPKHLHRIPLEYFERALRWLARQPGVDPKRIVTWGISRGGEAAFLLGTTYPRLVDAVVDYVGANTVFGGLDEPGPAWTLHGRGIPARTPIPIEKIAGPLFMVGGWSDALFGSGAKVESMTTELQAAHKRNFTALTYEHAGHAIGEAIPNFPVGVGVLYHDGVPYPLGGTLAGNAHAREDSWPKLLAFLARLTATS